jgi:hypothetical protein
MGAHGAPQQQAAAQPGQPAGFGWKPGNAAEQTAYLPPQAGGPQTLQAQQSASGSYAVPPHQGQGGQGGGERTQMIPPVPPTMQEYAPEPQPWQPQHGQQQHGQQQARPAHQGDPNGEGNGPFGVGNWQ